MRWQPPWTRRSSGLGILVATGDHPIQVWRVQNAAGDGPYEVKGDKVVGGAAESSYRPTDAHDEMEAFAKEGGIVWPEFLVAKVFAPLPDTDFLPHEWRFLDPEERKGFRFAFPTKAAVYDWFGKASLDKLAAAGFKLVPVMAGTTFISRSGRQVMYRPWTGQPERWRSAAQREREAELIADGFDPAEAADLARSEADSYNE